MHKWAPLRYGSFRILYCILMFERVADSRPQRGQTEQGIAEPRCAQMRLVSYRNLRACGQPREAPLPPPPARTLRFRDTYYLVKCHSKHHAILDKGERDPTHCEDLAGTIFRVPHEIFSASHTKFCVYPCADPRENDGSLDAKWCLTICQVLFM